MQLEKRASVSLCSGLRRRASSDLAGGSRLGQPEQAGRCAGTGPVVRERGEVGFG